MTHRPPGKLLAYEIHGKGEPLLLLHGAMVSRNYWQLQIEAFAAHYQVIACDLPGHGDSPRLDEPSSIAQFACHVLATLDHLGLSRVLCVGHSMGGMVAQHLALTAPERLAGLVLADTWHNPRGAPWEPFPFRTVFLKWLLLTTSADTLVTMMATGLGQINPAVTAYACETMGKVAAERKNYLHIWDVAIDFDSTEQLHKVACPTLVVVSDMFVFTQMQAYTMRDRIPGAELAVIPRSGHWVNWDNPEAFNQAVLEFLGRRCG